MRYICVFVCLFLVGQVVESKEDGKMVLPHTSRYNEMDLRKAIFSTLPNLRTRCYYFDGNILIGVFHDRKNKRLLFLLYPDHPGKIAIKKNGDLLKLSGLPEFNLLIAKEKTDESGKTISDFKNPDRVNLGFWLPYKSKDLIDIQGNINWTFQAKFQISCDKNKQWKIKMESDTQPKE